MVLSRCSKGTHGSEGRKLKRNIKKQDRAGVRVDSSQLFHAPLKPEKGELRREEKKL